MKQQFLGKGLFVSFGRPSSEDQNYVDEVEGHNSCQFAGYSAVHHRGRLCQRSRIFE
jgi:hypothetical protein